MKKTLIVLVLIISSNLSLSAQVHKVAAQKKPIEYRQPEGSILTIFLKGDEKLHWAETKDGYSLLSNKKGAYVYAKLDKNKNLIKSNVIAHEENQRKKRELRFLKKISKGLNFSHEQVLKSKK